MNDNPGKPKVRNEVPLPKGISVEAFVKKLLDYCGSAEEWLGKPKVGYSFHTVGSDTVHIYDADIIPDARRACMKNERVWAYKDSDIIVIHSPELPDGKSFSEFRKRHYPAA